MTHRVTLTDVAREAGVSAMTVSRVINNKDDVSPATRQHIQTVIDRLGYSPSGIARGLATRQTHTLGLVILDVANPFFSDVARGAEQVAYAEGYNVFLCNTDEDPERELAVLQSLEEKRVDGVVLCSSRLDDSDLRRIVDRHPAVVLVNRRLEPLGEDGNVGVVIIDDEAGGQMATRHLLDSGHQTVGLLAGPPASRSSLQRVRGYRAAMGAAGFSSNSAYVRHCSPTVEGGQEAGQELLTTCPELTALFCYNDLVAIGALHACADLGRSVPGDVAVVGFDDIPLAALVTPSLTTCRVLRHEMGDQAMRLLLDQIRGCPEGCGEIVLQPKLVIRTSAP